MLLGKFFGFGNVFSLAGFITACQQQHDVLATSCEIHPVARASVPTQFRHATAHTFDIAPVACSNLSESKTIAALARKSFNPLNQRLKVAVSVRRDGLIVSI